jgi:hypothetical protein
MDIQPLARPGMKWSLFSLEIALESPPERVGGDTDDGPACGIYPGF